MLSNKLTFSLVLVLMCAFVATSAFAQTSDNLNDNDGDLTGTDPLAAGSFVVYTKTASATANHGIMTPAATNTETTDANFPDIEDFLRAGGTIELAINIIADGTAAPDTTEVGIVDGNATVVSSLSPAAAAALKHRLIISEVMWGKDQSGEDADAMRDSQWIEIHNPGGALKAVDIDAVYLVFHRSRMQRVGTVQTISVDGTDTRVVIVDAVSLIDDFGGFWQPLGNGGNTAPLGLAGTNQIPPTDLISMYRKVNLEEGAYKPHDDTVLDGLGDGNAAGSWAASAGAVNMAAGFIGSPGSVHVSEGGVVTTFAKKPDVVPPTMNLGTDAAPKNLDPGSGIIINEVRNDNRGANLDWIELFNNTDPNAPGVIPTNVENWELSIVTVDKDEDGNYHTSGDDNFHDRSLAVLPRYKLAPGEFLVIYNRDPGETGLAGGVSIDAVNAGTQVNKGASHVYTVSETLNLPYDETFLIILRSANDKEGTADNVIDFVGNGYFMRQED